VCIHCDGLCVVGCSSSSSSVIGGGFMSDGWACSRSGECIEFKQEFCQGLDSLVGANDVRGVYLFIQQL